MRKRTNDKHVRLSNTELETLQTNAAKTGLSQEAYLRLLIMGYVPRPLPPIPYQALMKELRAIGNRVNQIAARANATGFFLKEEYSRYADHLLNVTLKIHEAVMLPERIENDKKKN